MTSRWRLFIVFLAVFLLAAGDNKVQRPTFLRAPSILTETEDVRVEVTITPHPDIRYVTVELWIAEPVSREYDEPDMPQSYEPSGLVRGSSEPITERTSTRKTLPFHFHAVSTGQYFLIAKAVTAQLVALETRHKFQVG